MVLHDKQKRPVLGHPSEVGIKDSLSESAIVRAVAAEAGRRVTRKVIVQLQQMTDTLSGEDSPLKTTWDEICVQIQHEESNYWDVYDETVHAIVAGYVGELLEHEQESLWLQTQEGIDWICEEPEERDECGVNADEIVDYLVHEYVYAEAGLWSNPRIRAYIDPPPI